MMQAMRCNKGASLMKHPSLYLDWYVHVPKVRYDFRSSGLSTFKYSIDLGEVDLAVNHAHGNPETIRLLARRYGVEAENVFASSEGASGQNARIARVLAEKNPEKNEAVVEYPTYEPLLRQVEEHFPMVKRLTREESEDYMFDADRLRKIVSKKTGLLVLTNPHLPSGAVSSASELREMMDVAQEHDFYVLCDEIYAEFNRRAIPTIFSMDKKLGIVTTSFSKAYGWGGLKLGVGLASKELVDELYADTLSTVGVFANIVEMAASKLLSKGCSAMERHKEKYLKLKKNAEKLLSEKGFEYSTGNSCITFWVKLPVKDTYKWIKQHAIPRYSWAAVPGAFFLFKNDYKLIESNRVRLGVGGLDPNKPELTEAFEVLGKALQTAR
jgi:aspartate/methionine/tyrosine aminotransferase